MSDFIFPYVDAIVIENGQITSDGQITQKAQLEAMLTIINERIVDAEGIFLERLNAKKTKVESLLSQLN